jgi:hypothetical protein
MAWNDEIVNPDASSVPAGTFAIAGSDGTDAKVISVTSSGEINISDKGSTASAVSSFTSTSSATLQNANSSRNLLTIFNQGAGTLYVLYGSGTASASNYSVRLNPGDYLEIEKYTGQVNAIFDSAGTALVTEIS